MDEKKHITEYEDPGEYRTGATEPPKSHSGLVAFLLIALIFLGGITSAMGLLNLHLFRQLEELESRSTSPVYFSEDCAPACETQPFTKSQGASLGFSGETVPYFWQRYRSLPAGIYITAVAEDGPADRLGITPGDILLSLDGHRVADTAALNSQLQTKKPGDSVRLLLYRNGSQIPFALILDKE